MLPLYYIDSQKYYGHLKIYLTELIDKYFFCEKET